MSKLKLDFSGHRYWYNKNNTLHRDDGPAIECVNGAKMWYYNGKKHREDGPACEYDDGCIIWFKNGKKHRIDGPAVEEDDGSKEWWLNGKEYTEEEYREEVKIYVKD